MSLMVTSSQRQAKHLPLARCAPAARRAPRRAPAVRRASASRSAESGSRSPSSPKPSASAASAPAIAPDASAASRVRRTGDRAGGVDPAGVARKVSGRGRHPSGLAPRPAAAASWPARLPPGDRDQVAVDPALGARRPAARRRRARRHRALDLLAADRADNGTCPRSSAIPSACETRRRAPRRRPRGEVGDRDHLDAGSRQGERRLEAAVAGGGDDRARPGPDPVEGGEALARRSRASRPGRSLPSNISGCSIEPVAAMWRAARIWCRVSPLPDRDEPVEETERRGRGEDLDPGAHGRARPARARRAWPPSGQQPPAELGAVVDEDHVGAQLGRAQGGARARRRRRRSPARRAWRRRYSVRHSRSAWRAAACRGRPRCAGPSRTAATAGAAG